MVSVRSDAPLPSGTLTLRSFYAVTKGSYQVELGYM